MKTRLQTQSAAAAVLQRQKAEKESRLFLRKQLIFTQQQQAAALRGEIEEERRQLQAVVQETARLEAEAQARLSHKRRDTRRSPTPQGHPPLRDAAGCAESSRGL